MGIVSCFNKTFLIVLNFAVFLAGVFITGLASYVIHRGKEYEQIIISQGLVSLPVVILIVGIIITLLGFFGCCGAISESQWMLYTYATVVLAVLLAGIVVGILIVVYPSKAKDTIKENIKDGLNKYGQEDAALNRLIDSLQHDLTCCGVDSSEDWKNTTFGKIPDSCCKIKEHCSVNKPSDLFEHGCFGVIYKEIKGLAQILGISALVLAVIQFFCICIACGLAKRRDQYV